MFNDRDFTSVAELLLVPGCPPGLFTKQFVEFAPSYANIASIFNAVIPMGVTATTAYNNPPTAGPSVPPLTGAGPAGTYLSTSGGYGTVSGTLYLQPYINASTPLAVTTGYTQVGTTPTPSGTAAQPHTFPYLIDKFFYSGYGATNTLDPGGMVGGYAADGWFKMFEFFDVPSQMIGAIGPVALGNNFDWARQDTKPGQLNLNLIIDEEVFFSVIGRQSTPTQSNSQSLDSSGNGQYPSDQYQQTNLNFDQIISGVAGAGSGQLAIPMGNYTPSPSSTNLARQAVPPGRCRYPRGRRRCRWWSPRPCPAAVRRRRIRCGTTVRTTARPGRRPDLQ